MADTELQEWQRKYIEKLEQVTKTGQGHLMVVTVRTAGKSMIKQWLREHGMLNQPEDQVFGARGKVADLVVYDDLQFLSRQTAGWRPICPKRARKLRRRGEDVRWLPEYNSHAWIPTHFRTEN